MDSSSAFDNGSGKGRADMVNGANGHGHGHGQLVNVQPPRKQDLQPSYAAVLNPDSEDASTTGWYGGMIDTLGGLIGTCGAIPCCIVCPNPYKPVSQGNVGLITRFGRFARAVDPGLVRVNPLSESLIQVDVKIQVVGTLDIVFLYRSPHHAATTNIAPQRSPNRSA